MEQCIMNYDGKEYDTNKIIETKKEQKHLLTELNEINNKLIILEDLLQKNIKKD